MRIASLAPSVTEILYELGADKDIVCSTVFCDYPEPARSLPKVGSWINVDAKKLREFAPDIVLTSSAVQGHLTTRLKNEGFRVINVNPMRLSEVVESYNQIGALVGREQIASRLVGDMYRKIMAYHVHAPAAPAVKVYCEEWSQPPMAAGNWVPDLVELAGGQSGIAESGKLSRTFAVSELQAFNPHVAVLHICGMGARADAGTLARRPGWEGIAAVANNRIHVIDDSLLNRPTSRLFAGLARLKEIIKSY